MPKVRGEYNLKDLDSVSDLIRGLEQEISDKEWEGIDVGLSQMYDELRDLKMDHDNGILWRPRF